MIHLVYDKNKYEDLKFNDKINIGIVMINIYYLILKIII